jgi:hypothetical protein
MEPPHHAAALLFPTEETSMALTLEIPTELQEQLTASASRNNREPAEYALTLLADSLTKHDAVGIAEEAREPDSSAEDHVYKTLRDCLAKDAEEAKGEPMPRTGAEAIEYWKRHGVLGAWADREDIGDSVEYARKLRRQAETREW